MKIKAKIIALAGAALVTGSLGTAFAQSKRSRFS